jgi:hypothetical protein
MDDSPLERRRLRVMQIRKRIAVAAAALFIAVFGGITIQLASGNDPALKGTLTTSTTSTTTAQQPATTSSQLTPVTTSQS